MALAAEIDCSNQAMIYNVDVCHFFRQLRHSATNDPPT